MWAGDGIISLTLFFRISINIDGDKGTSLDVIEFGVLSVQCKELVMSSGLA